MALIKASKGLFREGKRSDDPDTHILTLCKTAQDAAVAKSNNEEVRGHKIPLVTLEYRVS